MLLLHLRFVSARGPRPLVDVCRRSAASSVAVRQLHKSAIVFSAHPSSTADQKPASTSPSSTLTRSNGTPPQSIATDKAERQDDDARTEGTGKTKAPVIVAAAALRENIYTLPNLLTLSRIVSCPFLGYFIVQGNFGAATALLFYAGASDWVRRRLSSSSDRKPACVMFHG